MKILKFDIAIPVYNEELSIHTQINKLHKVLNVLSSEENQFQILIADNGSTDGTKFIAESLAASLDRVSFVSVDQKGVGLALRKAWENSNADIVGYMDLDLSTDVFHINEVISTFLHEESDVVNASRLLPTSSVRNRKVSRTLSSRGLNCILRVIFRTRISDAMCGFKFVKRSVLEDALANGAKSNGWFFATQLLLVAEMMGFRVKEIPVYWADDGNSKVRILSLSKQYLLEILELRARIKNSRYRNFVRL
jgi:glycosyltransferase involved in cell wall biosynthesis